jgi:hypothetical protein
MNQNKNKELLYYLSQIADKRRGAGQRHKLVVVLLIIIIGTMSGCQGYRSLGDFVKRHQKELIKLLGITRKEVPSYSTIRRVLMAIEVSQLSEAFYLWTLHRFKIEKNEWVAIDGKSIKGTVVASSQAMQDFVNLVSLYASKKHIVLGITKSNNKKEREMQVVQDVLDALELKDVIFTLDALHCQKKRYGKS